MLGAIAAEATPNSGFHRRLLLLGIDSVSTWSIALERTYPPSYYDFDDSTFLERRGLDGQLMRRDLLRAISHRDTAWNNRWQTVEENVTGFDVIALMRTRRVPPAYPSPDLERCHLSFTVAGVLADCLGNPTLLVPAQKLPTALPWDEPETVQSLGVFETPTHLLLLLSSGRPNGDGVYVEWLVPVAQRTMEEIQYPDDH